MRGKEGRRAEFSILMNSPIRIIIDNCYGGWSIGREEEEEEVEVEKR